MKIEVAIELIESGVFSNELLIKIGEDLKKEEVWEVVSKNLNFDGLSNPEKIKIAKVANQSVIDEKVAKSLNFITESNKELLKLLKLTHDKIWDASEINLKIINNFYLFSLTNQKLMRLGKKVEKYACWQSSEIWKRIANHLNFHGLSNKELLKLAKVANQSVIYEKVAKALNFSGLIPEKVVELAEKTGSCIVKQVVAGRIPEHFYLSELSNILLIKLSVLVSYDDDGSPSKFIKELQSRKNKKG